MIAWMLYTALVGGLIAAAGSAVDRLARLARRPTRWIWVGAMLASIALAAIAPYRAIQPHAAPTPITSSAPVSYAASAGDSWWLSARVALAGAQQLLDRPLVVGVAALERRLPTSANAFMLGAWLFVTATLAILLLVVHAGFVRALRRWPLAEMHGMRVRLSPSTGPVVIGLARPEIVVPRWMLDRSPTEQRVVLDHEAEHIKARDAAVLAGACAAAAIMPWNPAMWYMLSRVRLAVELDCDARVLRGGVGAKTYGTLLIDLAEQALPLRFTAAALADDLSHLHQRIVAMKPRVPRFAFARGSAAAAVGFVGLLAACEARLPTESDIKKMDATSAESAARQLSLVNTLDTVKYLIDGAVASELAAKGLAPEQIVAIDVVKGADAGRVATISIRTREGQLMSATARRGDSIKLDGRSLAARGTVVLKEGGTLYQPTPDHAPLFIIDGVRTDQATFAKLDRTNIEAVEVIKGKAAAQTYGPDAEHGVIVVTTKKK